MNTPLLSVIIPVYNAESYLDNCIQSLIAQSYSHLEIILVNDGSTDKSAELCEQYALKETRIKVIHQENGGQNSARKAGLDIATGEYITFADSDDWLDTDTYEKIIAAMQGKEFDLVCFDCFMDRGTASQVLASTIESGTYNRSGIISTIVPRMRWDFAEGRVGVLATVWNKIFKKSLLTKTMEGMDYQMTLCEDAAIVYSYIFRAQRILITQLNGYHYVQREGSMWHSYSVSSFEQMLRYQKYMTQELARLSGEYPDITPAVTAQFEEQQNQAIVRVLNNITRDVFGFSCNIVKWYPPYEQIPLNARIVLYGAGDVGQAYYLKFYGDPNYTIASWVDKKYQTKKGVLPPESILEADYDIVLIAVESEMLANQIKENLVAMGVDAGKIVWQKPQPVLFSLNE